MSNSYDFSKGLDLLPSGWPSDIARSELGGVAVITASVGDGFERSLAWAKAVERRFYAEATWQKIERIYQCRGWFLGPNY